MAHNQFLLPSNVSSKTDVLRIRREIEALEDYLHQAALRGIKQSDMKLPKTTKTLDDLARANKMDLLQKSHHEAMNMALDSILENAPIMHLSFNVEPSAVFTAKLTEWFRTNISPYCLIHIGLQPNIPAGCVLRTKNKQFDLTLRKRFADNRKLLFTSLQEGSMA